MISELTQSKVLSQYEERMKRKESQFGKLRMIEIFILGSGGAELETLLA